MTEPVELVDRRERHSKTFLLGVNADGSRNMRKVIAPVPIHYKDGQEVRDIHPTWERGVLHGTPYSLSLTDGERVAFALEMGGKSVRASMDMAGPITIDGHLIWWLDVVPDLDVCLMPCATSVALHYVLRSEHAPRRFDVQYDGDLIPQVHRSRGRDNIDNLVQRPDADMWRELEVTSTRTDGLHRTEWTGRAKAVDPVTRRRRWTTEIVYPVRIR